MKKICILSTVNLKHMTMISLYTDFFEENNIKYDIIYIDKYKDHENTNAENVFIYNLNVERNWSIPRKLLKYYGFKRFANKILKQNRYDFIIVWNSFTALMFSNILPFSYKNKYCINIRDYAKEKYLPIYLLMKMLIKNSLFTTISSDGFKRFLPRYNYITVHSFNKSLLRSVTPKQRLRDAGEKIRISFIGYVRFFDNDKKLIDALGNDERFVVQFFGEGAHLLEAYAKERNYTNIICKGRFESQETTLFLEQTDIINNLYGRGTPELDTALSIKLYYAMYMKIPILVYENTFMNEIANKYNLAITVNDRNFDNLGDYIYNAYMRKDFDLLNKGCNEFRKKIINQNRNFYNVLEKCIYDKEIYDA